MVIVSFSLNDKDRKSRYFEETFLLPHISIDVAFEMLFLTVNNVQINFNNQELKWKLYTPTKTLPTIRRVYVIEKKEFVTTALNPGNEAFVVYIASISSSDPTIHLSCLAQIAFLKTNEALIAILSKYTDFTDAFFLDLMTKFLKYTKINN